jgi:predicted RNA binding protein YcfA (HicA-like mRNA interferase family)
MPKFYSPKNILNVLKARGFIFISQKGSHVKYRKTGSTVLTGIIPHPKKQIPLGTFRSILRQANLTEEDFRK